LCTGKQQLSFARHVSELSFADVSAALEETTFCRRADHNVSRIPMLVDEDGWAELRVIYQEIVERALDVQTASCKRMAVDPDSPGIPVTALAFFFERPTWPDHSSATE
jgi:hypothetical protein